VDEAVLGIFKLAFQSLERNIARPIMEQKLVDLTLGEKLFVWFEANKKQVAWGAGIAVVLVVGGLYYFTSQAAKRVEASEALSDVLAANLFSGTGRTASGETYVKLAAGHPGTPAAAHALLLAGGTFFGEGKYAEAQSQFQRFSQEFPGHPFMSVALLGHASCLDAQGKVEEAERAYKDALVRFPNAYTSAQAKLGLARTYETQGKVNDALPLYEELSREEPFSSFGNEASFRLEAIKANLPAATSEPPAATNAPAFKLSTPPGS
jgi:tetratricopeptide (TPR) repeat protein